MQSWPMRCRFTRCAGFPAFRSNRFQGTDVFRFRSAHLITYRAVYSLPLIWIYSWLLWNKTLWMPYFECAGQYSKLVDLVEHAKFPIFASVSQSVETEALAFELILYFVAVICNRLQTIVLSIHCHWYGYIVDYYGTKRYGCHILNMLANIVN